MKDLSLHNGTIEISAADLKRSNAALRAFSKPVAQNILKVLDDHNTPMSVQEIYSSLKIEQSVASQHLAKLRQAKLVNSERQGKNIFYSINNENLEKFVSAIKSFQ